ncbi:MAG: hypothetical protein SOV16_07245 [Anaerobiospirillum succiniciproducens]|uniref:hypothetical protein n=1 Tax=Anaerobiospirillum succiniciproducens TaxID=13335 RepID=UPI002A755B12|nr:hypothetical protein [Anaerobiospirillum succiniciproducens]MDY2798941.1 hypothetical protein [Anaerobiospirillum succiniciproducens]
MFEDQSNSNIDSSKQDLASSDEKASYAKDASESNVAYESVNASPSQEHSVDTTDIDIDDLDLETLERLTNPEASDNDIESAIKTIASHSDDATHKTADQAKDGVTSDLAASAASNLESDAPINLEGNGQSSSDDAISFSVDSTSSVAATEDTADNLANAVAKSSSSNSNGVSVDIELEDQPRIQVFDENDHELSPDDIKYDAQSEASDENTAVYGKDERFADVNAEEAFGLTSDENVEAIIAALEETEAENNSLQMQDQNSATTSTDAAMADESYSNQSYSTDSNSSASYSTDSDSSETVALDDSAAQSVAPEVGSEAIAAADDVADATFEDSHAAAADESTDEAVSEASFVSAATNDDDSFLSDIESALEDSELFEQELAESVMQESTQVHNYGVTSATLSDDYKISIDNHDHLHEDYEVINPHPAALESAAEAARRFNALADQADGIESVESENDFSQAVEFDDSELEQAVLEQEAADLENLSKEDAAAYTAASSVNHEFQSDDEVVMNNNLTPSDAQLTSEQDLQDQKVSDTTSSSASDSASYEGANPLSNADDSSFSLATSLEDAQMSAADANNESLISASETQDSTESQADVSSESRKSDTNATDSAKESDSDNPFANLEHFDEQEDDSLDSDLAAQMAAAQEAMSQQLAKEAAEQDIKLVSADKFRNDEVSIMSDAMMMSNEGHTAIQGLEKRQQPLQLPRKNSYITGLSDDELEMIRRIKEMNSSKGSKNKPAQGYAMSSDGEEHSTVLYGNAAQAASERISQETASERISQEAASERMQQASAESSQNYDDSLSGVAAPITRDSSFASHDDNAQNYAYNDGTVQSADHYDEFSPQDGTYANNDVYNEQQNVANNGFNGSDNGQNPYSYNEYDENEVQAMPAQRAQEEVDDGPVYYVGPKTERVVEEQPRDEDNIYVGTYADRIAKQKEAAQSARQAAAYQAQDNMGSMSVQDNNSLADETFAAAQNGNNYVIPGNQEPQYYVGPSNPPVEEPSSFGEYEPSPYITPGVRTPEELAAEAAAREAAMQAHAQEQARIAEEQRREQEAARMAALAANSVDESDLAVPAGMGDGGALSMQSASNDQYAGEPYDDGPRYYVGPKEPSRPMQEAQSEAPIYAVGPDHSNAEVEANIQATRSKLLHDRALPPSYLDDDLQNTPPVATKSAEDIAYEEALAEAARESMAAPHSQVIENARKLAAEQESLYATKEDVGDGLFAQDAYPVNGETDGTDALKGSSSDGLALESSYARASLENANDEELKAFERNPDGYEEDSYETRSDAADDYDDSDLSKRQGSMRRDENGTANFANLNLQENVGLGMTVFLYLRQLLAAFFTHTNLPVIAPKTAVRLGPCYPSSMPVPYLFVGLLSGFVASLAESLVNVDTVGTISFIVFLLCTGLTPYRGIYRIISYISRRRHDVVIVAASVTVPMIIFMWLSNILILSVDGISEATAAYGIVAMLSAASASTLSWNLPQDPMDSSGTMTTKGLLFVIVLSIMASFGIMHYITGLSLIALCVAMRLIFGMLIAGNNGTSHRSYVHALQLLTMFILLFDLIILKSQGYNILSVSSLEFINQLRGAM